MHPRCAPAKRYRLRLVRPASRQGRAATQVWCDARRGVHGHARERALRLDEHDKGDLLGARAARAVAGAAAREGEGGGRGVWLHGGRLPRAVHRGGALFVWRGRGVLQNDRRVEHEDRRDGDESERPAGARGTLRRDHIQLEGDPYMPPGAHVAQDRLGPRRARREHLQLVEGDPVARRQRRQHDDLLDQAPEGDQDDREAGARVGRLRRYDEERIGYARDTAFGAGPARRGYARAPLEEADAHLRQIFRDGRQAQPRRAPRPRAAQVRRSGGRDRRASAHGAQDRQAALTHRDDVDGPPARVRALQDYGRHHPQGRLRDDRGARRSRGRAADDDGQPLHGLL